MGRKSSPSFELSVIISSFLHNSLCKISDYFKQQALGHRRFSHKYSRLVALPCAENHIFLDHVVISTVFQIIGTFTSPRTQTHHSAILRSSSSYWAFPPAISKFRLPSFTPIRTFLAMTSRFSYRLAPRLLLSLLLIQASHCRRLDQTQHL